MYIFKTGVVNPRAMIRILKLAQLAVLAVGVIMLLYWDSRTPEADRLHSTVMFKAYDALASNVTTEPMLAPMRYAVVRKPESLFVNYTQPPVVGVCLPGTHLDGRCVPINICEGYGQLDRRYVAFASVPACAQYAYTDFVGACMRTLDTHAYVDYCLVRPNLRTIATTECGPSVFNSTELSWLSAESESVAWVPVSFTASDFTLEFLVDVDLERGVESVHLVGVNGYDVEEPPFVTAYLDVTGQLRRQMSVSLESTSNVTLLAFASPLIQATWTLQNIYVPACAPGQPVVLRSDVFTTTTTTTTPGPTTTTVSTNFSGTATPPPSFFPTPLLQWSMSLQGSETETLTYTACTVQAPFNATCRLTVDQKGLACDHASGGVTCPYISRIGDNFYGARRLLAQDGTHPLQEGDSMCFVSKSPLSVSYDCTRTHSALQYPSNVTTAYNVSRTKSSESQPYYHQIFSPPILGSGTVECTVPNQYALPSYTYGYWPHLGEYGRETPGCWPLCGGQYVSLVRGLGNITYSLVEACTQKSSCGSLPFVFSNITMSGTRYTTFPGASQYAQWGDTFTTPVPPSRVYINAALGSTVSVLQMSNSYAMCWSTRGNNGGQTSFCPLYANTQTPESVKGYEDQALYVLGTSDFVPGRSRTTIKSGWLLSTAYTQDVQCSVTF